jgi:hypothetical protein
MKAGFSDALKRAALKFGVGHYLYRLPSQWCDFDPHKGQFLRPLTLPVWAVPAGKPTGLAARKPAPPKEGARIDAAAVRRLRTLADAKGVSLGQYLSGPVEGLGVAEGRRLWQTLSALPLPVKGKTATPG